MVRFPKLFFALAVVLSATLSLGATAWLGPTYTLDLPHVHQTNQTVTSQLDLNLQHDTTCDITVHVTRAGGEVLTEPGGTTLSTYYMLTGACLLTQDADWVSSADFLARTYHVQTNGPTTDVIHLAVKGVSPAGHAVPEADYTTGFVLTVTY
jgi:hypothetical protein